MRVRAFFLGLIILACFVSAEAANSTRAAKWVFETGDFVESSPEIGEGLVFIGSGDGALYALDAASGRLKWSFQVSREVESSPHYAGGAVYFGSKDGAVYALNVSAIDAYRLLWIFPAGGDVYSSPAVAGETVIVGSADHRVYAINSVTGKERWNYSTGGAVYSSPTAYAGMVYVGSNDNKLYALNLTDGGKLWDFETGGPVYSSPRVFNNKVYFGSYDGKVYCLDGFNGTLEWFYQAQDKITGSPAIGRSIVFVGSGDGGLYALNAYTGGLLWRYDAGKAVDSTPFFSVRNNAVYFGANDNRVHAVDASSGERIWAFETGQWVTSSPYVSGGIAYFGSYDKKVYAVSTITSSISSPTSGQNVNGSTLTIRGKASADAGIKLVEVQVGSDPAWHTATGAGEWSYTWPVGNLSTGQYQIRVRATDNNDEAESRPYANITVIYRKQNVSTNALMNVEFPERVLPGEEIVFRITDSRGQSVPFARIEMDGFTYYDENGDGVVESDQEGNAIVVLQPGEVTFNVIKEGYYVAPGRRLAIQVAEEDKYTTYVAGAAFAVVALVVVYIWRKRGQPTY